MINTYFIFAGDEHNPLGGFKDFKGCHPSYDEALQAIARMANIDWFQIVSINREDPTSWNIIDEGVRK